MSPPRLPLALIPLCLARDQAAWNELCEILTPVVRGFLSRKLPRDPVGVAEPDDLTQEFLLNLWMDSENRLARFRGNTNEEFFAYILRSAWHHAEHQRSRSWTARKRELLVARMHAPPDCGAPEDLIEAILGDIEPLLPAGDRSFLALERGAAPAGQASEGVDKSLSIRTMQRKARRAKELLRKLADVDRLG